VLHDCPRSHKKKNQKKKKKELYKTRQDVKQIQTQFPALRYRFHSCSQFNLILFSVFSLHVPRPSPCPHFLFCLGLFDRGLGQVPSATFFIFIFIFIFYFHFLLLLFYQCILRMYTHYIRGLMMRLAIFAVMQSSRQATNRMRHAAN